MLTFTYQNIYYFFTFQQLSLVKLATDSANKDWKLHDIRRLCQSSESPFWHCMNNTLASIQKGMTWPGRACCALGMSLRCQNTCARASRREDLLTGCRHSDEQQLFNCVERQEDGDSCCGQARTSECLLACKDVFRSNQTPNKHQRELVQNTCSNNNTDVLQCIKGYVEVTINGNLKHCKHHSSNEGSCVITCSYLF